MKYSTKEIVLIVCLSLIGVAILSVIKNDATLYDFIAINATYLITFLIIFALVVFITAMVYQRSLDDTDVETVATVRASIINIVLWCCFWISWCIFNVVAILRNPLDIKLIVFSFLLTNLPAIFLFLFTLSMRKDQIKSRPHLQNKKGLFTTFAGDDKSLSAKYYSGFYGLLTIPLYLLVMAVYFLIRSLG